MPALLDPSVYRESDAIVEHLIALLDPEDLSDLDEFDLEDRDERDPTN